MHKFKAEIIDWLNGGKYDVRFSGRTGWCPLNQIGAFDIADEVRKVDEYAHLKEAYFQGKTIQLLIDGKWKDIKSTPTWNYPIKDYRIKPKTKTLVKWLVFNFCTDNYRESELFYDVDDTNPTFCGPISFIKPLLYTKIEVET